MSLSLESLAAAHFEPLLGSSFELRLELVEVRLLGHRRPEASREPFALTFRGPANWRLPQGIHCFGHPQTGSLEIFVTQVGDGPGGSLFEAIFT